MKERTLKIFAVVMSVLLFLSVAFGVLMYYTDWGRDWSRFTSDGEKMSADGGLIIGEEIGSISLLSTVISPDDYETNGVPASAETAYTVTATVSPSNDATNTGVTWSGQWVNASSAWASGKALSDYVTFTPSGDGYMESKTVVIACLQAFGEPVTMTVTCTDAPDKTSSFQLDYALQPTGIELSFGDVECNIGGNTGVVVEVNYWADSANIHGGMPELNVLSNGVYTIAPEFTATYSLSADYYFLPYSWNTYGMTYYRILCFGYNASGLSPSLVYEADGLDYSTFNSYDIASNGLYFGFANFIDDLGLCSYATNHPSSGILPGGKLSDDASSSGEYFSTAVYAENYEALKGDGTYNDNVRIFDLTVTLSNSYFSGSYSTTFYMSGCTNTAVISNVSTDANSGILFGTD